MQRAARKIISSAALSLPLLLLATSAIAGAWTQSRGNKLAIFNLSSYGSDAFRDNQGKRSPSAKYRKLELNPYFEYGLHDDITVGGSLSLQLASQKPNMQSYGVGDSELFLRKRLWKNDAWVMSIEPMVKLPSLASPRLQPRIGSRNMDSGLTYSLGYGFDAYGQHHFLALDSQYRHRFGAPHDQLKFTATAGFGLSQHWSFMPQLFITKRRGHTQNAAFTQSAGDDYDLTKLQLSALYKVNSSTSIQAGMFNDLNGKNVGDGNGVLLSLWKNF